MASSSKAGFLEEPQSSLSLQTEARAGQNSFCFLQKEEGRCLPGNGKWLHQRRWQTGTMLTTQNTVDPLTHSTAFLGPWW